jgi:hypothetical protein
MFLSLFPGASFFIVVLRRGTAAIASRPTAVMPGSMLRYSDTSRPCPSTKQGDRHSDVENRKVTIYKPVHRPCINRAAEATTDNFLGVVSIQPRMVANVLCFHFSSEPRYVVISRQMVCSIVRC